MHIDTTWNFREVMSFRNGPAKEFAYELLVQTNYESIRDGISSFSMGASEYSRIMKTVALREGLDKYGF